MLMTGQEPQIAKVCRWLASESPKTKKRHFPFKNRKKNEGTNRSS
jgi:hypothetical protein